MNFFEFLEIMKNIPSPNDIDILCKSNENFYYLDNLTSQGYFKLLTPIQKYHLFTTACAYESVDIAMLLYKNNIDIEAVKEFMLNFMAEVGENSEYVMFRWLWEKKEINFSKEDNIECFIKILKSGNLEFIEWFFSLNIIDLFDQTIKKKIFNEILECANSYDDYMIGKVICEEYLKKYIII